MSDSDDTEDLLLIPPDFFVVHSDPDPPYYAFLDSLVQKVSSLQNRLDDIESMSDVSSLRTYLDPESSLTMYKNKSATSKRYYSHDDLYQPTSTQSTPQKPHERLQLSSLPNSPNVVRFAASRNVNTSSTRNSSKRGGEEVDSFISNVKTIQKASAIRNLDFQGMNRPDKITRDVQETIRELDKRIASEELQPKSREAKVHAWQCGDNINTVPDYGLGARDTLYKTVEPPNIKPLHSEDSSANLTESTNTTCDLKLSDSSSESTQLTAYDISKVGVKKDQERAKFLHSPLHDNALSVLNMHKKLSENVNLIDGKLHKKRGINTLSDNRGLLSLADIWGATAQTSQSPNKLSQKIQEEKMRRQHCEQLIQDLQNTNLELQQKLVVAVSVDESKNSAIQQYRDALDEVSLQLEKLSKEKSSWDRERARLENQFAVEIESANQKIAYYEKEASRSFNLSKNHQEKIVALEHRCSELQHQLHEIECKFKDLEESWSKEVEKNKLLSDIIGQKEIELKENKSVLNNAREEVALSRKAVEVCQSDFTSLKNESSRLEMELRDDKKTILNLNEQKKTLIEDIQTYKQNEKTLKDALDHAKSKLETTKVELRNFYQGQLEIIVENKRKEMQHQLDQERQHCLEEIKRKELSVAKTAANHIKEISEKCALETRLLEQKHQEEVRLYQMQLSQKDKEIETLRGKIAVLPEKRAEIAKQLQKAMENQWNEALRMISNGSTPNTNDYQNLGGASHFQSKQSSTENGLRLQTVDSQNKLDSVSDYDETPVSSRSAKPSESEIQKYINMLLNRAPGNPTNEPHEARSTTSQKSTWPPGDEIDKDDTAATRPYTRDRRPGKPPWK